MFSKGLVIRADAELSLCFNDVRDDPDIGVVILTGAYTNILTLCMQSYFIAGHYQAACIIAAFRP